MITEADVKDAAGRIRAQVRPVILAPVDPDAFPCATAYLAMEHLQHTGSFKARGAANFITANAGAPALREVGVTIASGGNAGLACAWAAQRHGVTATVFLPETAPPVKIARLRDYGADVRLAGTQYAHAAAACAEHATTTGALVSHAYDNTYIAAGAGTLGLEITEQAEVSTVVCAVGGGGLYSGLAAALAPLGVRVVAVEPENCRTLNAAIEAGELVDVDPVSVAADSLGARRASATALELATSTDTVSVLVEDEEITRARELLWRDRRVAVEHGAATALAALTSGTYRPAADETVAVVLCGANTDPSDLV
jgi:threonine dehydratase